MATYGDRYGAGPAFKPGSMALALGLTVGPIAALVMGLQITNVIPKTTILEAYPVPPDQPPPPPDPKPQPKTDAPVELVYTPPHPPVPVIPTDTFATTETPPPPLTEPTVGKAPDPGPVLTPVVIAKPVMVDAFIDPRYQNLLQPPYPPEEQRAGNSGRVVLRVLVGTDGRVKQVEKVSAASDAFFAAAQRQALGKWRFKPATQDGVPIEQWKTMSLRFVLNEQ
ncbi:energy transducer TonB [Sphingomonas sp.]|uniref:energy transducer TonB n=1 Tax=Sphingomonas sp. TaxID=28214 RepID=UPI0025D57F04|nr:energy transducer TonB [Sphingomonas sp.]